MANIRTATYHDSTFYHTIMSAEKCLKDGLEHKKPLYVALENAKPEDISLQKETLSKDGTRAYKCFGNMTFDKLNTIWKENHNLYEVLKNERKPYFDIEFCSNTDEEADKTLMDIYNFLVIAFAKIGIEIDLQNNDEVKATASRGLWKKGIYAGKPKYSFHVVINKGYKFASVEDARTFKSYMEYLIYSEHKYLIDDENKCVIDLCVYTKNRVFKLPYQGKVLDSRPQLPQEEFVDKVSKLEDYLISYGIDNYKIIDVSPLEEFKKELVKGIKKATGINYTYAWDDTTIVKYHSYITNNNITNYKSKLDNVSLTPEFFIECIYNDDNMPYDLYMAIGSALKRVCKDDDKAFKLWDDWSKKCSNYSYEYNLRQFNNYSDNTVGYTTLFNLAIYCNDYLKDFKTNVCNQLFNTDSIGNMKTIEETSRYINLPDNAYDIYENIFIKSPMGTGKSYHLKKLLEDDFKFKRVVYLSSRRAFASSMAADFAESGFKNYLDCNFRGAENRIIISLESLNKYCYDKCDLLIIDESESIFNIISSKTLIDNKFEDNVSKFYKLMKNSKCVLTMDAYLSNRSIKPVLDIRKDCDSLYYNNLFKYEEREAIMINNKKAFVSEIINHLKANKRICVVMGSSKLGQNIIDTIRDIDELRNKKCLYYNYKNQLNYNTNVNTEWEGYDLLMYSPTITCGISYTGNNYDNLFIYAVNKGSCLMRDTFQAHKRVRNFNDNKMYVLINEEFKGYNQIQRPLNKEIIKDVLGDYRQKLLDVEIPSIKNDEANKWIFDIHIHNILERNISDLCLGNLFKLFCVEENIKVNENHCLDELIDIVEVEDNVSYNNIRSINYDTFLSHKYKIQNNEISDTEMMEYHKFTFDYRLKDDVEKKDELFDSWFNEDKNRKYVSNIKKFKTMVHQGLDEYKKNVNKLDRIEYYQQYLITYEHIYKMFKKLGVINNDGELKIDYEFTTLDFDKLVDDYKNLDKFSINQLFTDRYHKSKNKKGEDIKFTTKTVMAILNKMLKEFFNYKVESVGSFKKTIDGKQRRLQKYQIVRNDGNPKMCVFRAFGDDFGMIKRK